MGFTSPYPASRLTLDATASINSGLVAFYPLTDETSSTALDISGNYHNGTMTNGAYFTGSTGIGRCAFFDGSNDYCTTGNAALSIDGSVGSISFWFKSNASQTGARLFEFGSSSSTGRSIGVLVTSSGDVTFRYRQSSTNYNATGPTLSSLGSGWNFAVATWDASNNINLYINGTKYTSTRSGSINVGNLDRGYIAERALEVPLGEAFQGEMQNVRCWTVELSQAQVDLLYARPWEGTNYGDLWPYSPPAAGSMTLSTDAAATSLLSGMLAWFPLTESTGTSAQCILHPSHTGTLNGGAGWSNTSIGNAFQGDGVDGTNITFSDSATSQPVTISCWWRSDAALAYAFDGTNSSNRLAVFQYNGNLSYWGGLTSINSVHLGAGYNDGEWHHIAIVFNGSSSAGYVDGVLKNTGDPGSNQYSGLTIGSRFNGIASNPDNIQNLRVWDRALTTDEITLLYERPWEGIEYSDTFHYDPPAPASMLPLTSDAINTDQELWLPLTDGTGTTAVDISGGSNDGTLTSGISWANSSLGNASEHPSSANEYISTGLDLAGKSAVTVSAWIRNDGSGSGNNFGKVVSQSHSGNFDTYINKTGNSSLAFDINSTVVSASNSDIPAIGTWFHVCFVWEQSVTQAVYINGVLSGSGTADSSVIGSTTHNVFIGGTSAAPRPWDGGIQNVRIWDRALTADEIWSIYANPWLGSNYKLASGSTPLYNYIFRTERFRRLG